MAEPATDMVVDYPNEYSADQTQPTDEIHRSLSNSSPMKSDIQVDPPAPSEYEQQLAQLQEKPHDPDGWRRLVELAESSGEIDRIRAAYDALLKQYPNTSTAQINYINHFLSDPSTFGEAEELFKKFLRTSPSVDLWRFYLTYVRRLNTGPATRDTVRKSYEFALNHVGQDKDSGEIWNEYIQFIKTGETNGIWEEQQKMDALRKVYQRAVQIPLDIVERLWQEYETFETNLNRTTAKKFMADLSPAHMQARATLRQLTQHMSALIPPPSSPNELYLPSLPSFDAAERSLVGRWKTYLKWEESNPLELEEKDKPTLITRIQGVYRKALIRMRYYTEIWYMAYVWTNSVGKHDEALAILKAGLEANPSSYLLTFTYAEAQETKKDYAEVHNIFENFLAVQRVELEQLEQQQGTPNPNNGASTTNGGAQPLLKPEQTIDTMSNGGSFISQTSEEKPTKSSELAERRTEFGLAWIVYMRFGRRAEGVKSSRAIFGKARKDRWTPWEVYEAAALMEYHCSDDKSVASRIFEKGLDSFGDEIEFVLRYLGFLISVNDQKNARALFERVIGTFPAERARPLWERWARYEYQYGDLEAAQKLEKRIAEVYPSDPPIKRFAQRHIYLGTDAIASRDLGFALARKSQAAAAATNAGAGPSPSNGGAAAAASTPLSASTSGPTGGSTPLGRTETSQSLTGIPTGPSHKRPPSPDYGRKRDDKRMRGMSPTGGGPGGRDRDRERERDRWESGGGGAGGGGGPGGRGRRGVSPTPAASWERERDRPPVPSRDRDDEKGRGPTLPQVLSWFISELPAASSFDGPVFRTDDLMNLFKNAVIPSTTRTKSPPAPSRGAGRPPPDYGPYQGPGGGRGRRY
ncbi:hypothetical protein AX16_005263 [Volvariella volvacea WC 439]|nr:hypothetical protein AX16_005263 [Volvariella volvacea WC 439]